MKENPRSTAPTVGGLANELHNICNQSQTQNKKH